MDAPTYVAAAAQTMTSIPCALGGEFRVLSVMGNLIHRKGLDQAA
jgi:hypothetical protein